LPSVRSTPSNLNGVVLDQLKESLRSVRFDLSRHKFERWLRTIKDNSQRAGLREAWPILEKAERPLVRREILDKFSSKTWDETSLGKALAIAADRKDSGAPLWNRKKKPQGYFIRDRFPHLIDAST
jgi:hypothetical protein